jgi:hypothetical protein
MGGRNSRPAFDFGAQARRDREEENRLNNRNRYLNDENNAMRRNINYFGSSNWTNSQDIWNKNRQLMSESIVDERTINTLTSTSASYTTQNNDLSNNQIPERANIVSGYESTLKSNNVNVNKKKFRYLKGRLRSIHAKRQVFDSVFSENSVIITKMATFNENNSGDEQNLQHKRIQIDELRIINIILFFTYYLLFFYFSFLLIFMKSVSLYSKIFLFLMFLVYPFFIYSLQYFTYYMARSVYLYFFPVYKIEKAE